MDLVNFQVGTKTISLAILNILLTEQYKNNLTEMPNDNPNFIGVKEFMNTPVSIFDLGKILNKRSTAITNQDVVTQLTELKFNALNDLAKNKKTNEFLKWHKNFKSEDDDLNSILTKVKELLRDEQIQPENKTVNLKLERLFDSAIEQVENNYKPIIVYTTENGRDPLVGLLVDKVSDSIHVDESDIRSLEQITSIGFELDSEVKTMLKGLVQIENKHSLIIDPSCLFKNT